MNRDRLFTLASLALAASFTLLVLALAVNIPQQDDFDSILFYLLNSRDCLSSGLFDIHVSHRLVITRLLARLSILLNGTLELRLLLLAGLLSLFGSLALFFRSFAQGRDRKYLLLICSLISLSLFHWSNMLWATASVQNYLGLFLASLVFYLFSRDEPVNRWGATLLAILAPYISSNGLLLLPLLLIWSLLSRPAASRRAHLARAGLLLLCAASFLMYFTGFGDAFALANVNADEPGFTRTLVDLVAAFLIAMAGYLHFAALALIAGALLTVYYFYLIYCRYDRKNAALFYSMTYLVLSIVLVALFRSGQHLDQIIASRYQVFTLVLLALMIVSFFELRLETRLPIRNFRAILLTLCTLLYFSSFYYVGNLLSERDRIISGLRQWQETGTAAGLHHPVPMRAARLLSESIQAELYRTPEMRN